MARLVLGILSGFVVMVIFILITFALVAPVLGLDRLFAAGTWEPSTFWLTLSISLSVAGAIIGGWTARRVGRSDGAVRGLAALVFVMGVWSAVAGMSDTTRGGVRDATATMNDAASRARQPTWIAFLNPLIGAAGALAGGRQRRS